VNHDRPAAGSEANSGLASLEKRQAELILEPTDSAADRRGIATERLGSTGKITGARRSRQILEVEDLHGLNIPTSARGTPPIPVTPSLGFEFRHQIILQGPLEAIGVVNCGYGKSTSGLSTATGRNLPRLSVRKISCEPGFC
jgi:hypothetical protein